MHIDCQGAVRACRVGGVKRERARDLAHKRRGELADVLFGIALGRAHGNGGSKRLVRARDLCGHDGLGIGTLPGELYGAVGVAELDVVEERLVGGKGPAAQVERTLEGVGIAAEPLEREIAQVAHGLRAAHVEVDAAQAGLGDVRVLVDGGVGVGDGDKVGVGSEGDGRDLASVVHGDLAVDQRGLKLTGGLDDGAGASLRSRICVRVIRLFFVSSTLIGSRIVLGRVALRWSIAAGGSIGRGVLRFASVGRTVAVLGSTRIGARSRCDVIRCCLVGILQRGCHSILYGARRVARGARGGDRRLHNGVELLREHLCGRRERLENHNRSQACGCYALCRSHLVLPRSISCPVWGLKIYACDLFYAAEHVTPMPLKLVGFEPAR